MPFHFAKPSADLAPYIKQYWGMNSALTGGRKHIQRIVPNGLMELSFYLGEAPRNLNGEKFFCSHSLISGQLRSHFDIVTEGYTDLFSVSLKPYGATMFFDIPMSEITDYHIALRNLVPKNMELPEEKLYEAGNFQSRVHIIEEWLRILKKQNRENYYLQRIMYNIQKINNSRGHSTIEDLAGHACLSRKQYERIFNGQIGLTPKNFLRIIRFQNAIHYKQKFPEADLLDLTYQCGYYDQSHMIRDFKALSGHTPKQYFDVCPPVSDYFE